MLLKENVKRKKSSKCNSFYKKIAYHDVAILFYYTSYIYYMFI